MKSTLGALALLAALAAASPTRTIVKRAEPSDYPGEGDACTNEPQYLNFDVANSRDKSRVEKIHEGFCNQLGPLIKTAQEWTEAEETTIFSRFFKDEDDQTDIVMSVWAALWSRDTDDDEDLGTATDLVKSFIIDNEDFLGTCEEGDEDGKSAVAAYTGRDEDDDDDEKTHFCDDTFNLGTADEIECSSLDRYSSGAMETFARIMLHEFLHYEKVGSGSDVESQIVDTKNNDGITAYYPSRAHALVTEHPELCENNADNYAWLAQNGLFADKCNKFFTNPPAYKKGEPGDPTSVVCARGTNNTCDIHGRSIYSRRADLPVPVPVQF